MATRYQQPQSGLPGANKFWVQKGLKSLYSLAPGVWNVNQVTGKVGGLPVGAGVTFVGGKLRTPGVAGDGAYLAHGLALNIAAPVTFVMGYTHLSGVVGWSLLTDGVDGVWHGWYGQSSGFTSSSANSFDGALAIGGSIAVSHDSGTSLRGSNGGAVLVDTTAVFPTIVNTPNVTLGWSNRGAGLNDNPGIAEFTHFAALQGSLTDFELRQLAANPWQLFAPTRTRLVVAAAGGGATGTLVRTNAADTSAATGTTTVTGTLAKLGANDSSVAAGTTTVAGSLARSNANDSVTAAGAAGAISGTVAVTNRNDTSAVVVPVVNVVAEQISYAAPKKKKIDRSRGREAPRITAAVAQEPGPVVLAPSLVADLDQIGTLQAQIDAIQSQLESDSSLLDAAAYRQAQFNALILKKRLDRLRTEEEEIEMLLLA